MSRLSAWVGNYREYAQPQDSPGVVAWDGLLLDGWMVVGKPTRANVALTRVGWKLIRRPSLILNDRERNTK